MPGEGFKALADPTRRRILELLREGNCTAGELAEHFDISKPSLSHHLATLKNAGLVTDERHGQSIVYSLNTVSYTHLGKTVVEEPEWDLIENELRAIDADGFRYSLHCQGDGAVRRTVALYASLPRDEHGRMLRRHAITDLENSDPTDLVEFGKLGGICEVYPQILTLDRREDCLSMMRRQIGETRLLHSWNRRGMEDSGCTVCCLSLIHI